MRIHVRELLDNKRRNDTFYTVNLTTVNAVVEDFCSVILYTIIKLPLVYNIAVCQRLLPTLSSGPFFSILTRHNHDQLHIP